MFPATGPITLPTMRSINVGVSQQWRVTMHRLPVRYQSTPGQQQGGRSQTSDPDLGQNQKPGVVDNQLDIPGPRPL